jgi:hypothetical protein
LGVPNCAVANFWRSQKLAKADGAPGRTRTSTMFPPPDFESGAGCANLLI